MELIDGVELSESARELQLVLATQNDDNDMVDLEMLGLLFEDEQDVVTPIPVSQDKLAKETGCALAVRYPSLLRRTSRTGCASTPVIKQSLVCISTSANDIACFVEGVSARVTGTLVVQ